MKTMTKSWMNMSADACSVPACQSASMTANCAIIMGTAKLAVPFLLKKVIEVLHLAVRIILPKAANP